MAMLPKLICLFHCLPTSATSVLNSANKKLTDKKKAFLRKKKTSPKMLKVKIQYLQLNMIESLIIPGDFSVTVHI